MRSKVKKEEEEEGEWWGWKEEYIYVRKKVKDAKQRKKEIKIYGYRNGGDILEKRVGGMRADGVYSQLVCT